MITQLGKGLVALEVQMADCLMSIFGFHRVSPTDEELEAKYEHGQGNREPQGTQEPYRGAKAVDKTCRNHGTCEHCKSNRLYKNKKQEMSANDRAE